MPESCKRAVRGGFAAITPQQPEEWELWRKTAGGSPQGAAAGRRQVKVGRLHASRAPQILQLSEMHQPLRGASLHGCRTEQID